MKKFVSALLFFAASIAALAQNYPSPTYNNIKAIGTATLNRANIAGVVTATGSVTGSTVSGTQGVILAPTTVSALPTCNTSTRDYLMVVTDATSPTYNGSLKGGGSVRIPVYCNGSAWTAH